ncbi:MAG TPA: DUF6089 family protein [Chitinophagaceae bacterium]|nr:DUF6089 family protein [Chitinophagaceae bacterium]
MLIGWSAPLHAAGKKHPVSAKVFYGLSYYLGDLGGRSADGQQFLHDLTLKKRTSIGGVGLSMQWKRYASVSLAYASGKLAGSDADVVYHSKSDPAYQRFKRNLDFRTTIREWSLCAEILPFRFFSEQSTLARFPLQPYLMTGIGRFRFNPQGSLFNELSNEDEWVDLQPLHTEGQTMKEYANRSTYELTQWNIPFGGGLQYSIGWRSSVSLEFIGRKLYTDYLDDVSTTYIDETLFPKYLNSQQATQATALHNKSALIEPDQPFKTGDARGDARKNDFYYSLQLCIRFRLSKVHSTTRRVPVYHFYKYDNSERCN